MANKRKPTASRRKHTPALPKLPPTTPEQRTQRLVSVCVDLLELCIEVTGTIDPAAAWLIAHAKDEVTLSLWGARDLRPY